MAVWTCGRVFVEGHARTHAAPSPVRTLWRVFEKVSAVARQQRARRRSHLLLLLLQRQRRHTLGRSVGAGSAAGVGCTLAWWRRLGRRLGRQGVGKAELLQQVAAAVGLKVRLQEGPGLSLRLRAAHGAARGAEVAQCRPVAARQRRLERLTGLHQRRLRQHLPDGHRPRVRRLAARQRAARVGHHRQLAAEAKGGGGGAAQPGGSARAHRGRRRAVAVCVGAGGRRRGAHRQAGQRHLALVGGGGKHAGRRAGRPLQHGSGERGGDSGA